MDKEVNLTLKVDAANAIKQTKESTKGMTKLEKAHKSYVDTLSDEGKEIRSVNKSKQQLKKQQDLEAQAANSAAGSYDQLSAQYQLNVIRLNQLNTTVGEASEDTLELVDATAELRAKMNEAKEAQKNFTLNVGDYKNKTSEALAEQDFFGTSINKLKGIFTSVTGAIGAAVAILAGLTKAYASSARGAEDLARASDRLNSIQKKIGNTLADSTGEAGLFDSVLRSIQAQYLGIANTIESDVVVAMQSQIRQLGILEKDQERQKKKELDDAEKLRQIRDDERNSEQERTEANIKLGEVINKREEDTIKFQEKKLAMYKTLLIFDKENIEIQESIKEIEFEIADAREEAQGFRSEQLINEMNLAKESNANQLELSKLRIEGEIQALEDGNEIKRQKELELVEITEKLQLEAAGKNQQLREIAIQEALNSELEINKRHQDAVNELNNTNEAEELKRIADNDAKKQQLLDELAISAAESEKERELLKAEQDFKKKELDIEQMQIDAEEKLALKTLLEEQEKLTLQEIRDKWDKKKEDAQAETDKKEIAAKTKMSKLQTAISKGLASTLQGILGDSLAGQIAGIAVEAGIQSASVGIKSSAAQATNLAQATAAAPPPLNAALIGIATGQNVGMAANTAKAIGGIWSAAALSAGSSALKSIKFANGGFLNGSPHSQGGIDLGFGREAEGGEFITSKATMSNPQLSGLVQAANNAGNNGGSIDMVSRTEVLEIAREVVNATPVYIVESEMTEMQKKVNIREKEFNG